MRLERWYPTVYHCEVFIRIIADKTNNTLTIIDNGVGMKKDDLEYYCRTLGNWSETNQFLEDRANTYDYIPAFGIMPTAADLLEDNMTKEAKIEAIADELLTAIGKRPAGGLLVAIEKRHEANWINPRIIEAPTYDNSSRPPGGLLVAVENRPEANWIKNPRIIEAPTYDSSRPSEVRNEPMDLDTRMKITEELVAKFFSRRRKLWEDSEATFSVGNTKTYHASSGAVVGFYSAYFIADRVVVTSKQHDGERYVCEVGAADDSSFTINRGAGEYRRPPGVQRLGRGTQITLYLRGEDQLERCPLYELVKEHAKFIPYPAYLRIEEKDSEEEDVNGEKIKLSRGWSSIPNMDPRWNSKTDNSKLSRLTLQRFESALLRLGFKFDEPNTFGICIHKNFKSILGIDEHNTQDDLINGPLVAFLVLFILACMPRSE